MNNILEFLKKEGFKEIPMASVRIKDYKEVIEYWDGITWRVYGK